RSRMACRRNSGCRKDAGLGVRVASGARKPGLARATGLTGHAGSQDGLELLDSRTSRVGRAGTGQITSGGFMLKNYRKFLTAGVLAFGLAACGDDVTITEPAPPPPPPETPNIVSFSVAPTNATIAVGQTVQASYNLQTKAGVAGTVAFASGNAAVASVDPATGLITA